MARPKIHTEYDPPPGEGVVFREPSLTKQSFREECDVNVVLAKYGVTPVGPHPGVSPIFDDFSGTADFLAAQCKILDAEAHFAALPSAIRDRFKNNPAELLAFVGDPKNQDEAVKLGLAVAPPVAPGPVKVEVVAPAVPPAPTAPPVPPVS